MLAKLLLWLNSGAIRRAEHLVTWWPHIRLCAAIMMDLIPDAQTLLMVVAGVLSDKPEKRFYSIIASKKECIKTSPILKSGCISASRTPEGQC